MKFFLTAALICTLSFPGFSINPTDAETESEENIQLMITDDDEVFLLSEATPSDEKRERNRSRSRSTSKSTSTSSSNSMTTTSTSTTTSGTNKGVNEISQLAIFPLFNKYKRHPNVKLTEIDGNQIYRGLTISDSPQVMAEIRKAIESDSKKAFNIVKSYDESNDNIVLNIKVKGRVCNIGLTTDIEGENGSVFLQYQNF